MALRKRFLPALALLAFSGSVVFGQSTSDSGPADLQKRIDELEKRMLIVLEELAALKAIAGLKADISTETDARQAAGEPEKRFPAKERPSIDAGGVRITLYGTVFFNAFSNTGGTNNIDVPMWATVGQGNTGISGRQTRLGIRAEGQRAGSARVGAVVEADFFGGVPGVGVGENFGVVRLRLANAKFDWERTSVTIGQDWMVFAPQNPVSLAAAAIPQLASAGNAWARLPQVKVEQKLGTSVVWQAALLSPQTGDSPGSPAFLLQPNSGSSSKVPFVQSRIAFNSKNWLRTGKTGTIGIAGHYGRSRVFAGSSGSGKSIDSLGVAADWNFPLAKRVSLNGEAFFGQNLAGFQAGVFQGYNTDSATRIGPDLVARGIRSVRTFGGWAQIGFVPDLAKDRLSLYASFGIDDPRDPDLVSMVPRDWRTRNVAFAIDAIYKFTPQFSLGAEVRSFRTDYFLSGPRRSTHVNFGAAYSF